MHGTDFYQPNRIKECPHGPKCYPFQRSSHSPLPAPASDGNWWDLSSMLEITTSPLASDWLMSLAHNLLCNLSTQ